MWNSKKGLERYIKILGKRITQIVDNNFTEHETDYYVMNDIKSVVVNSGLINTMGLDYMIQYRYYVGQKTYIAYKLIESKKDYLENKYTKEQAMKKLKPIMFLENNTSQEILNATMDDFDISQKALLHIIEERRERFPEEIQNEDPELITKYILNALPYDDEIKDRITALALYSKIW